MSVALPAYSCFAQHVYLGLLIQQKVYRGIAQGHLKALLLHSFDNAYPTPIEELHESDMQRSNDFN